MSDKLCPLLMNVMPQFSNECACRHERCAWYDNQSEQCCLLTLAQDATDMAINVEHIAAH